MQAQLGDAPVRHLGEDIITEILVRLPGKSVLRFRAVCKAWRRITTDPTFISDHALRRPPEILLYSYLYLETAAPCDTTRTAVDIAIDALPVSADVAGRRRLMRYPKHSIIARDPPGELTSGERRMRCLLLASCNGVLLFKIMGGGFYIICNPVTRQWAQLPRLAQDHDHDESAFYFHQPSGEYRLLCRRDTAASLTYYILSTGSAEPRHMNMHAVEAGEAGRDPLSLFECLYTAPVALHSRLHWPPHRDFFARKTMVAFDTVSETFHLVAPPPTTSDYVKLFDMDGLLVALECHEKHSDLWFLEDYGAGRWEHRHRVAAPWNPGLRRGVKPHVYMLSVATAGNDEGDVILGNIYGLMVYNVRTRKTVRTVDFVKESIDMLVSRHAFRESLVQHACFQARPSAAGLPFARFFS